VAVAVGVLLWLPPLIQQLTARTGNLTIIYDHFSAPPETPIGARRGVDLLLVHLNPWNLVIRHDVTTGSIVPGALLLAAWLASVVVAWRLRHRALLRLHLVLAVTLLLAASSLAKIFGFVWYYLALWAWGVNALLLLSVGWALAALVGSRVRRPDRGRLLGSPAAALASVAVVFVALFTANAAHVDDPTPRVSLTLGRLVPPTIRALDGGHVPGGGRRGRYLITWVDPVNINSQAYGLLLELERAGFHVGLEPLYRAIVSSRRVYTPGQATAVVHLSIGSDVATWRAKPGATLVKLVDPRNAAERREYDRLHREVVQRLRAAGLRRLIPRIDDNLFTATYDPQVPKPIQDRVRRMSILGQPAAVFVGPPALAG
jgi:hypothetical protein